MAKRTRSKSFFVDNDLKENPTFEKFEDEIKKKHEQMERKRKFSGTTPLKQVEKKIRNRAHSAEKRMLFSIFYFDVFILNIFFHIYSYVFFHFLFIHN